MSYANIMGPGGGGDEFEYTSSLMRILMAEDIVPGSEPSYETCKEILLFHPLGAKVAEAPIKMAQSQPRQIMVQGAPDEVAQEFSRCWEDMRCDANILNLRRLARVYGVASLVLGCVDKETAEPLDMRTLWDAPLYFNVFDPLNMSGSVIMNQVPNTPDFNQVAKVTAAGKSYHRSRYQVVTNEEPIYISYTDSGFGFTGRSVYQRALFPLKSFIKTMIADDMIATKNGLLVAKIKAASSVPNKAMAAITAIKRLLLKAAHVGQTISIDPSEDIATLNMQNVEGAGTYSRDNILKNIATAADMPAKLLQNETMVGGMAEGTEDAKNISKYIDGVRIEMKPNYEWCDNIVRYKAWMSPLFYKRIQSLYPDAYGSKSHDEAFSDWCRAFSATWPSTLIEPESEQVEVAAVKFEAVVAMLNTLLPLLDPANQALLMQWASDCLSENKRLFPRELELDFDAFVAFREEQKAQQDEMQAASLEEGGTKKPLPKFDSVHTASIMNQMAKLQAAVTRMAEHKKAA